MTPRESPHFADHLPAWYAGRLARVTLDPARLEVEAEVALVPAGCSA